MLAKLRFTVVVAGLCILISSCLSESVSKPVRSVLSPDHQYRALVHLDEGSPISGGDWYSVEIVEAHPKWFQVLPRVQGVSAEVCVLEGPGKLGIQWSGPTKLDVTCTDCAWQDFFIYKRSWKWMTINYRFRHSPSMPDTGHPPPTRVPPAERNRE